MSDDDEEEVLDVPKDDMWGGLIALCVTVTLCLLVLHWAGVVS